HAAHGSRRPSGGGLRDARTTQGEAGMRKQLLGMILMAAAPLTAQDHRFTKELRPGDRIEIENINGAVEVSQGTGRTAIVEITKTVREGDGNLVKAVMEESAGVMRVCTIYLNRNPDRTTCAGDNSDSWGEGNRRTRRF